MASTEISDELAELRSLVLVSAPLKDVRFGSGAGASPGPGRTDAAASSTAALTTRRVVGSDQEAGGCHFTSGELMAPACTSDPDGAEEFGTTVMPAVITTRPFRPVHIANKT